MFVTKEIVWESVRARVVGGLLGVLALGMVLGMWLVEWRGACP